MNDRIKTNMLRAFEDFLTQVYPDRNKATVNIGSNNEHYKLKIELIKYDDN